MYISHCIIIVVYSEETVGAVYQYRDKERCIHQIDGVVHIMHQTLRVGHTEHTRTIIPWIRCDCE